MNHSFFLPGTHLKDDRSSPAAAACVGMPWWSSSPAPGAISTIPWGCPQMPVHSESSPNHYDLVPKIGWIMPKNVVCLAVAKWSFHRWKFRGACAFKDLSVWRVFKLGWPVTTQDLSCRYHEFWVKFRISWSLVIFGNGYPGILLWTACHAVFRGPKSVQAEVVAVPKTAGANVEMWAG